MKELLALSSLYITALDNRAAVAGRSLTPACAATLLNNSDLMLTAAACAH
jgi:hypothetical protein